MNPISAFLAWRNRRRAARIIAQAEHKRTVTMAQIANAKSEHREYKPLLHPLRQYTSQSLQASVDLRRAYVGGR